MKNYLILPLLLISTSVLANTHVLSPKFHHPNNKEHHVIKKVAAPTTDNKGVISPKFHHPDNKEHHVIKKSKKVSPPAPTL